MPPILDITNLTKRFGDLTANDAVALAVQPGEVVGLLGHNGAGKTTLVKQIVGLMKPDTGQITVNGVDAIANPAQARLQVSLQAQSQAPLDGLTPYEAITIAGQLHGMKPLATRQATEAMLEQLDINSWRTTRALPEGRGLSGGIRRLTAFAMAVVCPTPLLILDEPTNDVDVARRRLLWHVVRQVADTGVGVLLVTHNVHEAEQVVDDLYILDHGRVVASGSPDQLRGRTDQALRLELLGHHDAPLEHDKVQMPPITWTRQVNLGRRVLLTISTAAASQALQWAESLTEQGVIDSFSLGPVTLEDLYLDIVEPDASQETTHAAA